MIETDNYTWHEEGEFVSVADEQIVSNGRAFHLTNNIDFKSHPSVIWMVKLGKTLSPIPVNSLKSIDFKMIYAFQYIA